MRELEKQKEVLNDIVIMLRDSYGVTKKPMLKFVGEEIMKTIKIVEEMRKALLKCSDYDSLRKEVIKWFGAEPKLRVEKVEEK